MVIWWEITDEDIYIFALDPYIFLPRKRKVIGLLLSCNLTAQIMRRRFMDDFARRVREHNQQQEKDQP
jgi:hypothetical protein